MAGVLGSSIDSSNIRRSGGAFSSRVAQVSTVGTRATDSSAGAEELGPKLSQLISASAKQRPLEDIGNLERECLALLGALHDAYSEPGFQSEIQELLRSASGDEVKFIKVLGPVAAQVQAPVFKKFGLPPGIKGIMLMKMGVKLVGRQSPEIKALAGDLRELLFLAREEEFTVAMIKKAESGFTELVAKIDRAPLDVRGPLAEALRLPYKASAVEIAKEVPKIKTLAREMAEKQMGRDRCEIIGGGKVLGPEMAGHSDNELRVKLMETFEHYMQKMLARVVTPVESFTRAPVEFCCPWAEGTVQEHHVRELWGPQKRGASDPAGDWLSLGVGVTVADSTVERELVVRARAELDSMEAAGMVKESKDPCNTGARSMWLHFESEEEKRQLTPALQELCLRLAGLPHALGAMAAACAPEACVSAPKLRVHPHVMAATYRHGAEYHCHKDSYDGADNQRMLSVLFYMNHDWNPGDDGELRLFGTVSEERSGKTAADPDRFVDIAPLCGRIVMFRSREVWHSVREPREQRWALTLWVMAE